MKKIVISPYCGGFLKKVNYLLIFTPKTSTIELGGAVKAL
jgi:hypothetical protein